MPVPHSSCFRCTETRWAARHVFWPMRSRRAQATAALPRVLKEPGHWQHRHSQPEGSGQANLQVASSVRRASRRSRDVRDIFLTGNGMDEDRIIIFNENISILRRFQVNDFLTKRGACSTGQRQLLSRFLTTFIRICFIIFSSELNAAVMSHPAALRSGVVKDWRVSGIKACSGKRKA
jgi:hypothetical protein